MELHHVDVVGAEALQLDALRVLRRRSVGMSDASRACEQDDSADMAPDNRRNTAYHVAGHALVSMLGFDPDPVGTISIIGHVRDCDRCKAEHGDAAVRDLLRENSWRLDALAAALMKYKTLDEPLAYAAAGLPEPGSRPGSLVYLAFRAA